MKKTILAVALAIASMAALAAEYYVVVPVKGRTAAAPVITLALNNVALPSGMVSQPYAGFSFANALQVSGDPSYAGTGVAWSITGGALPAGLTLSATGALSGTPTAVATNQSFQLQATYKGVSQSNTYSLSVVPYDGDPDWNSVVSLINFDGSWTDLKGVTATPSGSAALTSDAKFGNGGASFGSAAGAVTLTKAPFVFGGANFTVEMFIKPNNTTHNGQLAGIHKNAVSNDWLFYYKSGKLEFMWGAPTFTSSVAMTAGQWHHVAVTRNGSTMQMWLDGNQVGSAAITGNIPNVTSWPMAMGGDGFGNLQFNGSIDAFRVTVGKARYTSAFTPPTVAFPTH